MGRCFSTQLRGLKIELTLVFAQLFDTKIENYVKTK